MSSEISHETRSFRAEGGKSLKRCMVLSFVYVTLTNGSLKRDTKAAGGGGLDLTFCTRVLGKAEGEGSRMRNGSCCEG